jgi:hypothetical protein
MTHPPSPPTARTAAAMTTVSRTGLVLAALALAAGCSTTGATPPVPAPATTTALAPPAPVTTAKAVPYGGLPDPAHVDQRDATALSRAALVTMWTVDSDIDTYGQRDAYLRAVPYLTSGYAARAVDTFPALPPPAQWTQHHAYAQVTLAAGHDDPVPDQPTGAQRQWVITVHPTGRDGWHGDPVTVTANVALTRVGPAQPWRILDITFL